MRVLDGPRFCSGGLLLSSVVLFFETFVWYSTDRFSRKVRKEQPDHE